MHRHPSALLILAGLLACCGGSAPKWRSADEAYEAGERARASRDYTVAAAAYGAAASDAAAAPALRHAALLALGEIQVLTRRPEEARQTFEAVKADALLDAAAMARIAEAWLRAGQLNDAEAAAAEGERRFPDKKAIYAKVREGIAAARAGDAAALKNLGYAD